MGIKFTNNAFSTLDGSITDVATTINLAAGTGALFPSLGAGDYFYATLYSGATREIVKVTARSTDALTVVRGQEGTTNIAWDSGSTIGHRVTAETLNVLGASSGTGGTTATGDVTLSTTTSALTVTPSAPGLYATLPDATTVSEAVPVFSVYNAGDYDYGVKDSTGTVLGWVRPRTAALIGLSDNSTAAGVWSPVGLEKLGVTAKYINSTLTGMGAGTFIQINIDANRTCLLFGETSCYAIIYDASSQTWGSATLVRSTIGTGRFLGVLSATDQVMVCSCSSTTALEAVTLTLSGTGITVNSGTKGTATLAGNFVSFEQLIAVGSSFVLGYSRQTTTNAIRAISISGTTPTIGAESTLQTTGSIPYPAWLFASGSIVRTLVTDTADASLKCKPFTVSGSTLTPGADAWASFTGTGQYARACLNGNGNIVCHYANTTHYASIFKLTGTTEAVSSVSLGTFYSGNLTNTTDYVAVTASKTAFVAANATTWYANILTDTAGTASVGTEISGVHGSISYVQGLAASGNSVRFGISALSVALSQLTLDCSGASPTLSSVASFPYGNITYGTFRASDQYGVRYPTTLFGGSTLYSIGTNNSTTEGCIAALASSVGLIGFPSTISGLGSGTSKAVGAANEIWNASVFNDSATGYIINRVEAAA